MSFVSYINTKINDVLLTRCRCRRRWCCCQNNGGINITNIYDITITIKFLEVTFYFLCFRIVSPSLSLYVRFIGHVCMFLRISTLFSIVVHSCKHNIKSSTLTHYRKTPKIIFTASLKDTSRETKDRDREGGQRETWESERQTDKHRQREGRRRWRQREGMEQSEMERCRYPGRQRNGNCVACVSLPLNTIISMS